MPCCLIGCLALIGPRFAGIVWWILDQTHWNRVFDGNLILPLLGILIVPWTTLAYVWVAPFGVEGLDWVLVGIGLLLDIGAYMGGWGKRTEAGTYYRDRF